MVLPAITLPEVFDDISSRFLINLPDEELQSFDRLFFQLQEAAWFYSDFYSDRNPHLPKLDLKHFCSRFFQHSPILAPHWAKFETHFSGFKDYLGQVPVCGAIMLTPDLSKCLLVKGWGKSNTWGFPKGKINKQEPDSKCAAREVFEEIGHDISDKVDSNQYIEVYMSGKRMRLFIVRGISETTVFQPQTRKEISQIAWFPVSELTLPSANTPTKHKMYAVAPFIGPLRRWIDKNKGKRSPRAANRSSKKQQNNNKQNNQHNNQHNQPDAFWGHQQNATVGYSDNETFGQATKGWDPEEMFATNQKLFNVRSTVPEESTVLTPAEQAKYQQHLSRLGLNSQRYDNRQQPNTQKSPQKQRNNRNQRNNKPQQQQQQVKILARNNNACNFPQPNKPQPLKPNNQINKPASTANSFLNFKFDTSAIMGSFAISTPITV